MNKNIENIQAYYDGIKDGISKYAWWKNGIQYVGTTGKTLKEAYTEVNTELELELRKVIDSNRV